MASKQRSWRPTLRELPYPAQPPQVDIDNLATFPVVPNYGHLSMDNPLHTGNTTPKYLFIRMRSALNRVQTTGLHEAATVLAERKVHRTTKNHGDEFHQVSVCKVFCD
jgi:hypothetical protein